MIAYALVFLGGGLGSMTRFLMARLFAPMGWVFPLATLASNLASCFILGLLVGIRIRGELSAPSQFFFTAGFCGGFSTFSTFSLENMELLQEGRWGLVLANVLLSVVLGLLAVYLGMRLSS